MFTLKSLYTPVQIHVNYPKLATTYNVQLVSGPIVARPLDITLLSSAREAAERHNSMNDFQGQHANSKTPGLHMSASI